MRVLVLNGPNLNLLGIRRPDIYGTTTLAELEARVRSWGADLGMETSCYQSNHEGALIDRLHESREDTDAVVVNPGGLTHYSYALLDAIEAVELPTVEVHISNIREREEWRRHSVISPACVGTIYGRGIDGYRWALRRLHYRAVWNVRAVPYGPAPEQVADLRLPDGEGPHPVAMLLHGGFWLHQWGRDLMDGIAVDLAERGIATWNVEYRRVGAGGGWPASGEDVDTALRELGEIAEIDASRLALVGHSAGAQLALVGAASAAARGSAVRLVVSLAGITDLAAAVRDRLDDGAASRFLEGADPGPASPMERLPLRVAQLVAHAEDDARIPVSYSRSYAEAARRAGDPVDLLITPVGGHLSFLDPDAEAWRHVAERLESGLLS